jgi:hypothetical protein
MSSKQRLYELELQSFEVALDEAQDRFDRLRALPDSENLTANSFEYSNRLNYTLVGLSSLVEAKLYEVLCGHNSETNLDEVSSAGPIRLMEKISKAKILDFGRLRGWDKFTHVYKIRNCIVHAYGGMVGESERPALSKAIGALKFDGALVGERRVRLGIEHLSLAIKIVRDVLKGIDTQVENPPAA